MSSNKRRHSGADIRAKATNGNIRATWTLTNPNTTVNDVTDGGAKLNKDNMGSYVKWSLWRKCTPVSENYVIHNGITYPTDEPEDYKLVGLIEKITKTGTGQVYAVTTSMRGVIHVPVKFFTKNMYDNCQHPLWGKVYEYINFGTDAFGTTTDGTFTPGNKGPTTQKLVRVFFRI